MFSYTWPSFSPLLFARNIDQDLEFDDEFDDLDDPRYKPPRRRWLLVFLLLLLGIGTWYVVTDPERRASVIELMPDTVIQMMPDAVRTVFDLRTEDPERDHDTPPPSNEPPVPAFHEGQRVAVGLKEGRQARLRLRDEVEGEPRGAVVKTGDVLTIIDGSLIKKKWIYFVQTEAGESGWIKERYLQPQT